jgi:uncharacterized protein (TIGR04551 family)
VRWLLVLALLAGCPAFHPASPPGAAADATFVDVDGLPIHYRALGSPDAEVVVLIHGFGASLESWRGVQDALAHHFRVIAIDLPGFGFSGRPPGDYSPVAESRLVWRALDRLGVGDASLVGHSWGSSVVLSMTLEQPARVKRVALYSAYVYEDQVPAFFHWARLGGVGEAMFALWYGERVEDRVALAYHDDRYVTQARVEHAEAEFARPGSTAAALASARGQQYRDLETHWPEVKQPVLLLWGDDDQVTPLRFGRRLANDLPDATLKIYGDCGHVPMVEARRPTTRDLLTFLLGAPGTPADVPELPETLDLAAAADRVPLHQAADLALLGAELAPRKFSAPRDRVELDAHGAFRVRGESLYNLDLDHGLDDAGQPLFPVPLDGGQTVDGANLRFRTDLAAYSRGAGVAVKTRIDILDNLTLGSTPDLGEVGTPSASPGQQPPLEVVRVERIWGEVLTPFGILAAGRMGAHWGLGMVASGGDCDDCDGGDAADRVALVTPVAGHLVALSYDFTWSGPETTTHARRAVDLAPADDVTTVTAAILRARTPASLLRRSAAGLATVEYGAYISHRWQADDVPAAYFPVVTPPTIDPAQLVARDFSATTTGAWLRFLLPRFRLEVEAAYGHARVGQPSLVPGVELTQPATSDQLGLAIETEARIGAARLGLDAGFASGDDAPGFTGPQADPPGDTTADNFRFHPDYHVDRILFREIIGTVTDAAYVRPHLGATLLRLGHGSLDFETALIASWAIEAASTPTGQRGLGFELDPGISFVTRDGFRAALEYALFLPGAAFDPASTAQLIRLRLGYVF